METKLRALSDMTNNELIDVVEILLNRKGVNVVIGWTPDRDYVTANYDSSYPESDFNKNKYDKIEMTLCISEDFTIYNHWYYIKGNGTGVSNEPLYNCHKITKYLIEKGFDLYGIKD